MPVLLELPTELRRLFDDWNAREVTESGWEDDTRRLIAEIAEASGLSVGPDLDTLLRDAGAAMERLGQLESERKLQSDQIERLKGTVAHLTRKLAEAGSGAERADLAEAFAALARGDTLAAEDAFEREYEARQRAVDDERHAMAEAARNVANLAMLHDVTKAVRFYRKALEVQPDHADTARMLGYALMLMGDLKAAQDAFASALTLAQVHFHPRDETTAHDGLGDVLKAQGDSAGALAAYRKSLAIREVLASRDLPNTSWQRDLSISHNKIGDVLRAQGDGAGALVAYRQSLAIREALAASDPDNTLWQRDLSVSHSKNRRYTTDSGRQTRGSSCLQPEPRNCQGLGHARRGQHRVAAKPVN